MFVDIGASDGITWSNSYLLEKCLGWQGTLLTIPNLVVYSLLSVIFRMHSISSANSDARLSVGVCVEPEAHRPEYRLNFNLTNRSCLLAATALSDKEGAAEFVHAGARFRRFWVVSISHR